MGQGDTFSRPVLAHSGDSGDGSEDRDRNAGKASSDEECDADGRHDRVRILHIAESALGGVGTYLNQIVPRLALRPDAFGRSIQSRVLLPEQHRRMVADIGPEKVFVYQRLGRSPADVFRLARTALAHIRDFRPDIVHLHSTYAGVIVRPLLLLSRLMWQAPRSIVYSPHGWAFQISAASLVQRAIVVIERFLSLWTNRIVVLSDAEMRECLNLGFRQAKLVRIYNGLASVPKPAAPAQWDDPRLKVFFTGRFDRQKGLDVLMQAAERAQDRIVVRCAGASVVDSGTPLTVPANVELLGWLSEEQIEGQLACADIVAVPSRWEGFGLVAVEAMRARLPVVASRIGGLPEVVSEGVSGYLVPPDDPEALLAALLADDAAARRIKGEAGCRRFLAMFTSSRSAEALGEVYSALLGPLRKS